jgi:asparagine synthetase B (glutamine-hydrolysing)
MLRNLMTVIRVAGLSDPSDRNICGKNGRMLTKTGELTADRIIHLRGKIEVEIEDRLVRFEVQEDERAVITFQHLLRRLGIRRETWQIVNIRGEIVTENDRLFPGKKYSAVQKDDVERVMQAPLTIRVHFKVREQSIPVLPEEPFENILLAIELALNVPGEWKLCDQTGSEVTRRDQLIYRQEYWARQKEPKVLKRLMRTDDRTICLKRIQDESELIETEQRRLATKEMIEESSVRIPRWRMETQRGGGDEEGARRGMRRLRKIRELREFKPPQREMNDEQSADHKRTN